jgi:hypothetical protein
MTSSPTSYRGCSIFLSANVHLISNQAPPSLILQVKRRRHPTTLNLVPLRQMQTGSLVLRNQELHNLYFSPNITATTKAVDETEKL